MFNIGIDLIEIERIQNSLKHFNFLIRMFSNEEIDMFKSRNNNINTISANFAAKEALAKAINTPLFKIGVSNISVLRNKDGSPYFKFKGNTELLIRNLNISLSLSLTHSKTNACAVVLAYKNKF